MLDTLVVLLFVSCPFIAGVIIYIFDNRYSDKSTFKKNLFDWIVYVLAWLAIPFFIISIIGAYGDKSSDNRSMLRGRTWEERRRWNLYILVLFCIAVILFSIFMHFIFALKDAGNPIENKKVFYFIFFVFFAFVAYILCSLYKLLRRYEDSIRKRLH